MYKTDCWEIYLGQLSQQLLLLLCTPCNIRRESPTASAIKQVTLNKKDIAMLDTIQQSVPYQVPSLLQESSPLLRLPWSYSKKSDLILAEDRKNR